MTFTVMDQPSFSPSALTTQSMNIDQGWAVTVRNTRHIGDFTRWQDHDSYFTENIHEKGREAQQDGPRIDNGWHSVSTNGTLFNVTGPDGQCISSVGQFDCDDDFPHQFGAMCGWNRINGTIFSRKKKPPPEIKFRAP